MPFCTTCAAEYKSGQDRCEKCGNALPQSPRRAPADATPSSVPTANRFRRLLAGAVDLAICVGLTFYLDRFVIPRLLLRSRFRGLAAIALLLLIPALYAVLRDALGGKSIGKLFCSLTAVNLAARRPAGFRDSFLRNIAFGFLLTPILGWTIFAAIAVIAGFQILTGKARRIGDRLAGTTVVDDRYLDVLEV